MSDLYEEIWSAIKALRPAHRERLGLAAPLDIGIARVRFHGGLYEPCEDGETAILLPVFDAPELLEAELYDIGAWRVSDGHMATRMGSAMCLGSIDPLLAMETPLPLYRTPRSWPGTWDGAVVIDWDAAGPWLLGDRMIVGEDHEHGLDIQRRLGEYRQRLIPDVPPVALRKT